MRASVLLILWSCCGLVYADNIDSGSHYAWGENVGWINFKPLHGVGVTVSDAGLSGYAWAENMGWINLNPSLGGVLNTDGQLSGYAWGENVGWINFAPTHGGVRVNGNTGLFSGFAWGENVGWINFAPTAGGVNTSWRAYKPCNVNVMSGVTKYSSASYGACETLVLGPDFVVTNGASISLSSGWGIDFMPGFKLENGATLDAKVCGQSLCMVSNSPMPNGCHPCVNQICGIDDFCCTIAFDRLCLDRVSTVCGLVCE